MVKKICKIKIKTLTKKYLAKNTKLNRKNAQSDEGLDKCISKNKLFNKYLNLKH